MDEQVFLATKFGVKMGANGQREIRNDPEYIRMAVDRSLKRLQTEYIDLWYWYVINTRTLSGSSYLKE